MAQVEHGAGPHPRVAGVGHQQRILGQVARQLGAEPFGPHRREVRLDHVAHALLPGGDLLLHPRHPGAALGRQLRVRLGVRQQAPQGIPGVALQPDLQRVVAAQLRGVDVELHDAAALRGDGVAVGDLTAGVAADEEHQIGLAHDPVGAFARVGPRNPHRQRVVSRKHRLGVERRGHRNGEPFRERNQLRPRPGGGHPAAGHDHRPLRLREPGQGLRHLAGVRLGPKRRYSGKGLLDDHLQVRLAVEHHLAGQPLQIEVRRSRSAAGRGAKRLPQVHRQIFRGADVGAVLGDRGKRLDVIHFLVGVALLAVEQFAAGQRDHRRARQPGILQPGGQIHRPHRLRHAQAGAAPDPGVGVGHVRGRLLAVGLDAANAQLLHLHQGARAEERHEEHVGNAISAGHFGDETRAGHSCHDAPDPTRSAALVANRWRAGGRCLLDTGPEAGYAAEP